jgi:hypothetical protein
MSEAAKTENALMSALIKVTDALEPFVIAYGKSDNPGNSDLDDEQPYHVTVTLGDCRRAARVIVECGA